MRRRKGQAVRTLWLAVVGLVATAALGAGCGGGGSDETITIGVSLPLTGEFSQPGKAAQQGYELWRDTVNDNGGLLGKQVELVVRDDASNQNTVVADYNDLIQKENVDLLLGTFSSLLNLPASATAERNRMLYVEPAGGAPEIFQRDFQYGPFFTQQATADHQGDLFVDWVLKLPPNERPRTAAYPVLDDPFAQPVADTMRSKLEAAGVQTVYHTVYPPSTSNFDSIANSVKSANPDLVVNGAQFEDGIGFRRALTKVGFEPKILFQTNAPSFGKQYSDGVGVENANDTFFAISHTPDADTPGNDEFVKAFQDKFGDLPAEDAADAYASGQVLQAAVEGVGSVDDQLALADWLRDHSVETILGKLSWQDSGAPIGQFLIGQWQNGKAEIVLPNDAATSDKIVAVRPASQ
jgi:branched-chain amino acid transport system substrate-binding protein